MHDEFWQALRAWRARGMVHRSVWDYRFDLFIEKLNCPVLLMAAPDDVLYLGFRSTAAALPRAKAVELSGSNFERYLDAEGVAKAVDTFLSGV